MVNLDSKTDVSIFRVNHSDEQLKPVKCSVHQDLYCTVLQVDILDQVFNLIHFLIHKARVLLLEIKKHSWSIT